MKKLPTSLVSWSRQSKKLLGKTLTDEDETPLFRDQDPKFVAEKAANFRLSNVIGSMRSDDKINQIEAIYKEMWTSVEKVIDARDRTVITMKRGYELRSGVPQMV